MKHHKLKPESQMMSFGYKPQLSEGAVKCPIFQTSTFAFNSAEEGKAFFELAYGLRAPHEKEEIGLIYSRINNPDLEILENRLALWEEADDCAVFESGMSAITTVLLEFLNPGDLVLTSSPVYGGTDHFMKHVLPRFGIHYLEFMPGMNYDEIVEMIEKAGLGERLAMIYVETPANPTNALIDLDCMRKIAKKFSSTGNHVYVAVDNTYMGPLWQKPLEWGADISLYSATKYIGGHSDVIAGACVGSAEIIKRVKTLRTFIGNMAGPWTGWLLLRSLETLKLRMEEQARNAQQVADWLVQHPKIEKVYYLGLLSEKDGEEFELFKRQCTSPGAMLSFDVKGGEAEAFEFLNKLKMIKLAVSLGSTESLAQHPATMTHAGVHPKHREEIGITSKMIRLSVGVENVQDIIWDIEQALS